MDFTDEIDEEICALYFDSYWSVPEIKEHYVMTAHEVKKILGPKRKQIQLEKKTNEVIAELVKENGRIKLTELSKRVRMIPQSVAPILKDKGLKLKQISRFVSEKDLNELEDKMVSLGVNFIKAGLSFDCDFATNKGGLKVVGMTEQSKNSFIFRLPKPHQTTDVNFWLLRTPESPEWYVVPKNSVHKGRFTIRIPKESSRATHHYRNFHGTWSLIR